MQGKDKHLYQQENTELKNKIDSIKIQNESYHSELENKEERIQILMREIQTLVGFDLSY